MNDSNHALDILGRKLGLSGLSFDDEGLVALAMSTEVIFYITRIDMQELEISCGIPGLGYPDHPLLRAMLQAHYLGAAVGASRLALDADSHDVILCERWVVTDMEAAALERRFDDFAANAAFWLGEGSEILLEQAETLRLEMNNGLSDDDLTAAEDEADQPAIVMRL